MSSFKQIIEEFEENKIEDLELARQAISIGEPSVGCDLNEIIRDNDRRINALSYFLYYYQLLEINIKNHKEYSKPSNYDEETLKIINENIVYNYKQYKNSIIKLKEAKL